MKNFIIPSLLAILIISCSPATEETQQEPVREITEYTIEQLMDNINIRGGSFSPNEDKLLITSDETGIYNAYVIDLKDGSTTQLTTSEDESVYAITYFPNDERILLTWDEAGNELSHIYVRDTSGKLTDLTPFENSTSGFFDWSEDDQHFFFASNKRDPKFFDLYLMNIENYEYELIYENEDGLDPEGISRDENLIALGRTNTTQDNNLYLYNRTTKELKHISEHEGDAEYGAQYFSNDSKYLYYTTDEGQEFKYLVKYNIESGEKETVFKTDWSIWYAYSSKNETYQVMGINEDGRTTIKVIETATGKDVELPQVDGNINSVVISKSEKLARFSVGSSTTPGNIFLYDFESRDLRKLTNALNEEINPEDLVKAEVIRYKSFDGLEIPAIYYKPHNASPDNLVPALVWVHGGPGGQTRATYRPLLQYLVNHGYAILGVNNRGSSGYGKTFNGLDNLNHGENDLMDCVMAKEYFKSTGYVDTNRIGIIGGSYGGYMTMAALTYQPEEFEVGVNIFGVTNWLRTLKSIPPYWESFRKALYTEVGDPFSDDSVRLYKMSPLFHAGNVVKPLMVLQGANDPRVLQAESDEIVAAVRANGVPVEYVLFEDEGHGFRKAENRIEGYGKILEFLDKYLKGKVDTTSDLQ